MSEVRRSGEDTRSPRVRRPRRTADPRPATPTTTTRTREARRPREDGDRSTVRTQRSADALERDAEATRSDREASREITRRQASTSRDLTDGQVSFAAMEDEDSRPAGHTRSTVTRDGVEIDASDAHLYNLADDAQAEQAEQAQPPTPVESATSLGESLEDADNPQQVLSQQMPGIMESLQDAPPEVVSQTMEQFSQIAHDNPELARAMARQFGDHPPQNLNATLQGLAGSSAAGRPELSSAIASLMETEENPSAAQFRSVANLHDAVQDINGSLEPGNLEGAGQAADRISAAIDGAPPEVAQALLRQLDSDGSLGEISNVLDHAANEDGLDGDINFNGETYGQNNPLAALGEDPSDIARFDRLIGSLSQAVTAAGDDELTQMVAGHITEAVGEGDIRRFDESFALSIANGGGAGLAGAVATRLQENGNQDRADDLAESVEDGMGIYLDRFDETADRVDQANNDLNYMLTQWAPFYPDTEEGQAALNEQIEAFRENHPEYAELEQISGSAGGDLEVLRELQGVFPDKGDLRDRELSLLAEVPRFGATDAGRRSIGEAVARRGDGEETFLDRMDDQDFLDSLPDDYYEKLGYENRESFETGFSQMVLNGSMALMSESASQGDTENVERIGAGLVEYHELLGEDREALQEVVDANQELMASSITVGRRGANAGTEGFNLALERFNSATQGLSDPATANRLRAGGALTALGAGGLSWWATAQGGVEGQEALSSTVDSLEGLLTVGGAANSATGGTNRLLSTFSDDLVRGGGRFFGAAGAVLDAYSLVRAAQDGDWAQAGISAVSVAGGIATALGATGVGLALGVGAAVIGLGYAQYKKIEASNRFETPETEAFIRGALEHAGVENDQLDEVVRHLRNADDEGRNVGVLIAQAAERRGMDPIELLSAIARQDPDQVLDIMETGHGIDPRSDDLTDLRQTHETDSQVGERSGTGRYSGIVKPQSVEGFLEYLEDQGVL